MITRDLRHSIARAVAAAGFDPAADPGLRPAGAPGRYAASVALAFGAAPRETAAALAATLRGERYISRAEVTGPGYLAITVTPGALAAVAAGVAAAGPACVASDALAGRTLPAPPPGDPLEAADWPQARAVLAAQVTARLAAAAGATVALNTPKEEERQRPAPGPPPPPGGAQDVGAAVAFAGPGRGHADLGPRPPGQVVACGPRDNREAGVWQSRLCCEVRARPRRVRGALGGQFPDRGHRR